MIKKPKIILLIFIMIALFLSIEKTYSRFVLKDDVSASIDVPEDNYCINNGFNKLTDCILLMENYSSTVDEAKTYISSKGTVTTSTIAPTITYEETTTEVNNANGVISTSYHFTLGKSYTFNKSTGVFSLSEYTNDELTDDYIDYYTCGSTSGTTTSCTTMYQIKAFKKTESTTSTTYYITSAIRHSYIDTSAYDSEVGLYQATDYDGNPTYFYRGNVQNNYLSYGGFIWRIVRRNSDGSIRIIYSGTTTSATGSATSIGTSQYNSKYYDPTYVGYKYNEDFELNTTNTTQATYSNIADNTSYYFGSSYTFDETTKKFSITGDTVSGKWKEINETAITNYPYTCLSTSKTGTCNFLLKVISYVSVNSAKVNYISYSSKNYESTLTNTTDSVIKEKIDTWYETNLLSKTDSDGNAYSDYLTDGMFCNDRSVKSGSGYLLAPTTTYGPYYRLAQNKTPSLSCSQESDMFTVANGNLKYPIALLTIDEASLAGGKNGNVNNRYYLYTGQTYWTMSPCDFDASNAHANVWNVNSTGRLHADWSSNSYGVRPVVNLSSDVLLSGGDGTADNPYVVTLSNT